MLPGGTLQADFKISGTPLAKIKSNALSEAPRASEDMLAVLCCVMNTPRLAAPCKGTCDIRVDLISNRVKKLRCNRGQYLCISSAIGS